MANPIRLNVLIVDNKQPLHKPNLFKSHNIVYQREEENGMDVPTLDKIRKWMVELPSSHRVLIPFLPFPSSNPGFTPSNIQIILAEFVRPLFELLFILFLILKHNSVRRR